MAIKNNIRSIRFSDELMEIINDQVGDNFNQRFERLVYNCYMLLPEKERQLRELENQIAQRRRQLEDLVNRYHSAAGCLRSLEYQLRDMQKPAVQAGRYGFVTQEQHAAELICKPTRCTACYMAGCE